mgnify:CR=1 FL=1
MERNGKETDDGCPNCRFWVGLGKKPHQLGECHRHAPAPAPQSLLGEPTQGEPQNAAIWPVTDPEDWCGDWECEMRSLADGLDMR